MFFCWSIYPEKIYVHLHVHNVLYYSVYLQNTLYLYSYIINFVPRVVKIDAYVVHKIFTLETIFRFFYELCVSSFMMIWKFILTKYMCIWNFLQSSMSIIACFDILTNFYIILWCTKKLALSWIIQFVYCYVLKYVVRYVFRVSTLQGVDVCHLTNKMI